MNILFLCKRRPQNKDLLNRPYGRFYFLPYWLAKRGHTVTIMLLSYKRHDDAIHINKDGITWISESFQPWKPFAFIRKADQQIPHRKIDWIIGFSDTYYGIMAERLASKHKIKSCIDAYDNYESYLHWMKPLHWLWRRSLSKTSLISAAGRELAELMCKGNPNKPRVVVPMAPGSEFTPMDKTECREHFGLPLDKIIIGYSGALHDNRGVDVIHEIIKHYQNRDDVTFVFSGRRSKKTKIHDSVKWLGYLPDQDMPLLLNAYDVLLVVNKPSAFGNYSYPVKLYEAMACQTPVVVADVAGSRSVLTENTQFLAEPLNPESFIKKINLSLLHDKFNYQQDNNWLNSSKTFEQALLTFSGTKEY